MQENKHIVCYSGGIASSLVGAMVLKKFGSANTVWLNHPVNAEPIDVSRYEKEFADYHNMEITYVSGDKSKYPNLLPFEVFLNRKYIGDKSRNQALCTEELKTKPFERWLKANYNPGDVIYYGFDKTEVQRIQRRSTILAAKGYKTGFPLVKWDDEILTESYLERINIKPPMVYEVFKHANCRGCVKAGMHYWLCVYVHDRKVWNAAKKMEDAIGRTIFKDKPLKSLEEWFDTVVKTKVPINQEMPGKEFWARVKRIQKGEVYGTFKDGIYTYYPLPEEDDAETRPCECVV